MTAQPTPTNQEDIELAQQLHEWYLEVTAQLNPKAFNKQAQKPFKELTGEQQAIDRYIAEKLQAIIANKCNQARIDELKLVMKQTETGDVSIWVYKWAKNRIAELTKGGNNE